MNPADILKYGHSTVLRSLDGLPETDWHIGGVCGVWSVKDIIGHLAAYEHFLEEIIAPFAGMKIDTPMLGQIGQIGISAFNDVQADVRKSHSVAQIQTEYNESYHRVAGVAAKVPAEIWPRVGTIPWYGPEYSLDDFIVYTFYGHKREHCAQINVFKDRNKQ
jgi:hypothetical protein